MKTRSVNTSLALTGLVIALLPVTALAAPAKGHSVKATPKAAVMYECQKCHMKVTGAVAKKDGYKDPMDGGKLVTVKMAHK